MAPRARRPAPRRPTASAPRTANRLPSNIRANTGVGGPRNMVGGQFIGTGGGPDPMVFGRESVGTRIGQSQQIGSSVIDQAASNEIRARQLGLADVLNNTISGQGPSVAESQLRQEADRNASRIQGQVAAATTNPAQRARMAAMGAAEIQGQTNQQAATLRAQEQLAARSQLTDLLQGTRTSDLGVATNQAGLQQQANLANQQAVNERNAQNAQLQAGIEQARLGANATSSAAGSAARANMYGDDLRFAQFLLAQGNPGMASY